MFIAAVCRLESSHIDNEAVFYIAFCQSVESGIDVFYIYHLAVCRYIVAKTEVEHLLCLGDAPYIGAREASPPVYYVECCDLERFGGQTYYYQRAVDTEEVEVKIGRAHV